MGDRVYEDAITIDGINVLPYLFNYRIKATKDVEDITDGTIRLTLDVSDVLTLQGGQDVIISRGLVTSTEYYVIRGKVMKFEEENKLLLINVEGRLAQYKRMFLTKSYDKNIDTEAGNPILIWADIVDDGGLTSSYVNDTTIVVDKFVCNDSYRFERMGVLVKLLGWQQRDDYTNNYVRLEPVGYTSFATTLAVGTNVVNVPVWEEDLKSMRNFIKIHGARVEDTKVEQFAGDAAETVFTVEDEPEITKVTLDGVEQTRGVVDSTSAYNYTVDKQLKTFTFVTPPGGAAVVLLEYTYLKPRPVQGKDYTSVELYDNLEQGEVFKFNDIETVSDAKDRLKTLLKYLAYASIKTQLFVEEVSGIEAGMIVPVEDQNNTKYNNSYIVNEIVFQYPEPYDILKIGSTDFDVRNLFDSINQRLKLLEQDAELNQDELTSLIQLQKDTQLQNRYFKKQKATANTNMLILDHPTQSTLDNTNYLFGGSTDVYSTEELIPGNNQFKEYATDSEFYDSSASSGITVNTTTNVITIAATTGAYYTKAISINALYTKYIVSLGTVSATGLTIEISPDAKGSWETVTLETLTEFTGTVSNVYVRITNTTGGIITITVPKDDGNQITGPAMEVGFE